MPSEVASKPSETKPSAAYYPLKLPTKLRKNLERLRVIKGTASLNALIVQVLEANVADNAKVIAKIRELQAK